jgi:two-component system response regulator AtoC
MISGEKGVGKRYIAKLIHNLANEKKSFCSIRRPPINNSFFEKELLEILQDEKNPDATDPNKQGTLFINEISKLDESSQSTLLKCIQEKKFTHTRRKTVYPFHFRIISTTEENILEQVEKNEFRKDLYYRLYVTMIEIPPLRERIKDIELLANEFIKEFCDAANKPKMTLSNKALKKLIEYSWPGNVSELKKIIENTVSLTSSEWIPDEHIIFNATEDNSPMHWVGKLPIGKPIKVVESYFILKTLEHHKGNRTHTSKTLGISLRTLRNKIAELAEAGFEVPVPLRNRT